MERHSMEDRAWLSAMVIAHAYGWHEGLTNQGIEFPYVLVNIAVYALLLFGTYVLYHALWRKFSRG